MATAPGAKTPCTGKLPRRPDSTGAGLLSSQERLRRPPWRCSITAPFTQPQARRYAFSEAWRNLSIRWAKVRTFPTKDLLPPPVGRPRVPSQDGNPDPTSLIVCDEFRPVIP
jgi:hypothetical protein